MSASISSRPSSRASTRSSKSAVSTKSETAPNAEPSIFLPETQKEEELYRKHERLVFLRFKKENLIKALRFEESAQVEAEIQRLTRTEKSDHLRASKQEISKKISETFRKLDRKLEKINEEVSIVDAKIRMEIDAAYKKMQGTHLAELTDIERDCELSLLREDSRESNQVIELKKEAMKMARKNDVETAVEIKRQAEVQREIDVTQRKKEVAEKYEEVRRHTVERQGNEMGRLQEKLIQSLEQLQAKRDDSIAIAFREARVSILRVLQRQTAKCCEKVNKKEKGKQISKVLSEYAAKLVKQKEGEFNLCIDFSA